MWNYDNTLSNYVERIILTYYLNKFIAYCVKQKRFFRNHVAAKFEIVKTETTILEPPWSPTI